jgi:hypothetical protein
MYAAYEENTGKRLMQEEYKSDIMKKLNEWSDNVPRPVIRIICLLDGLENGKTNKPNLNEQEQIELESIRNKFYDKEGEERSEKAKIARAKAPRIVWTAEEDAFLAEQALKCNGLYQVKLLVNAKYPNNRSLKAVQIRVAYLRSIGLIGEKLDIFSIYFSPEQDNWLMENYQKMSYEKMAERLYSTAAIVGKRVRQLKFERGVE